nr:hypothetical protein [Bradyrhizobium sp. CIR3A]
MPGFGLTPPGLTLPLEADGVPAVRVLPAAEYDCFTSSSHDALWSTAWKITPQSDRYGYRLAGPELNPLRPLELASCLASFRCPITASPSSRCAMHSHPAGTPKSAR